jgi:hypothetical protein
MSSQSPSRHEPPARGSDAVGGGLSFPLPHGAVRRSMALATGFLSRRHGVVRIVAFAARVSGRVPVDSGRVARPSIWPRPLPSYSRLPCPRFINLRFFRKSTASRGQSAQCHVSSIKDKARKRQHAHTTTRGPEEAEACPGGRAGGREASANRPVRDSPRSLSVHAKGPLLGEESPRASAHFVIR